MKKALKKTLCGIGSCAVVAGGLLYFRAHTEPSPLPVSEPPAAQSAVFEPESNSSTDTAKEDVETLIQDGENMSSSEVEELLEKIAAQEEKTKQEAYKAVFKDAAKFDTVKLDQKDVAAVLKKNDLGQNTISEVVKAVDKNGKELGYVFSVTNPEGYGGDVSLSVGVRDDGTVNGYETLSISETAGLGMKAKEPEFKSNFKNKKADKFEVVKDGSGKNDDSKVDAISGATITSRAVTSAVNSCVAYSKSLKGGN